MKNKKTIIIIDIQLYAIYGGGQVISTQLINGLKKEYNVVYIGNKIESAEKVYTLDPFNKLFYFLNINKHLLLARGLEKLLFRFKLLSPLIFKKIILSGDVVISNSVYDFIPIYLSKEFKYNSVIIIKHNPFYNFNSTYPGVLIRNKKYKIIALNKNEKNKIDSLYGNKNTSLIYNGVDCKSPNKSKVNHSLITDLQNKKIVVSIGRLSEKQKQFSLGIKAIAELIKRDKNIIYVIIGKGKDENYYKDIIKKLKIERNVKLLGFVNEDTKNFILSISSALLVTSSKETFGLTMIEGFYFGIPTISTRTDGAIDIIKEGKNGFFVNPNPEEISKTIYNVINLPAKDLRLIKKICKDTYLKFRSEVMIKNYKKIIRELVNN
jgi:glycosyltransferase involved in cell wall biosynthesis